MQSPDNHYQQMSPMNHGHDHFDNVFEEVFTSNNSDCTQKIPIHHQSSFGPANPYSFKQEGSVDSSTRYLDLSPIQQRYFRSSAHPGRPTHSEQEGHFHHHIQDVEGSPVPPPSHQHNSTSPPPPDGQSDVPSTGSDVLLSPAHPAARKSTRKKGRNQVRMELNERGEAKINLDYGLHVEATQQKSTPFKRAAFDAIRQQDNKSFASHAEKQEAAGNKLLLWATIPHSASFKASDKAKIINEGDFTRFLAQSLDPGTHQCHVSVKEIKPQKLALKAAAISKLDSSHGKRNRSDGEESDTWEASFGAVQSTDIMNAMTMILATHKPQGKITGHHEANVYINPEDPTQWMWVIHPLAGIWARAVVKGGAGVSIYRPPKVPGFDWAKPGGGTS
ncbi:hypothetical protein Pst134EA_019178 [Puccinia striiformis f. sp. tritici]|uniref:hypothetical protein n=1 Tax=Puccinia striiformis f. sp. tritici TaxID=168172 RepID=UPI002008D42B|nr:hypothetical protein Pst134EA_019178 [Puccinia striiformis f. sp. tritici]KAH9459028.1 hypothetical protein Pst134EA_019178 [Puccinia striiformis f. sp. tritici]